MTQEDTYFVIGGPRVAELNLSALTGPAEIPVYGFFRETYRVDELALPTRFNVPVVRELMHQFGGHYGHISYDKTTDTVRYTPLKQPGDEKLCIKTVRYKKRWLGRGYKTAEEELALRLGEPAELPISNEKAFYSVNMGYVNLFAFRGSYQEYKKQ